MNEDKAERYVQIVPLLNADHKRIARNKSNPLQRIKVSNSMSLSVIAAYIHRLAGPDAQETVVSLHVPYGEDSIQLPLSMTAAEFLLITNQDRQGELMYSFVTPPPPEPPRARLPPPKLRKEKPPPAVPTYPGPPPESRMMPPFEPPPPRPVMTDSINPLIHTGFSIFSNSFGIFPPTLDSVGFDKGSESQGGSVSLRKGLEQILSLQNK